MFPCPAGILQASSATVAALRRKRCGLRCRPVAGSACGSRGPRRRRRAGTWPGAPSGSCELRHRRAEWSSAAASVWALRRWESPAPSRISAAPAVVPAPGTQILFPATTHTNASSKKAALVQPWWNLDSATGSSMILTRNEWTKVNNTAEINR